MGDDAVGFSFGDFPTVENPDFDKGNLDPAEYMAKVMEESTKFQLQMMAYNAVNAANNKAIDTMDKVVDRQAN